MNLNNYYNRVILRKQKSLFNRFITISLILFAVLLITLPITGCRFFNRNHVISPSDTLSLTAIKTQKADQTLLAIPIDRPLSESEAVAMAERLIIPLESYDVLRPGGAADLLQLEKVVIERVVDGDTLIVRWQDKSTRLRMIGIDAPESYSQQHRDAKTTGFIIFRRHDLDNP